MEINVHKNGIMERKYYEINEEMARQAHDMMSFSDYKTGSKTAEYRAYVDKAYDLADKVAEKRPGEAERAYGLAERYSKKLAENMNKDSAIGTRCPSVMIAGPAKFPTRKKVKQVAAWDRNHEEWNEIQGLLTKIERIRYGKDIIKSSDEDAVEKLEKKLGELKAHQESMKAANKAIRMKDTEKGDEKLKELGYSLEEIKKLREPDFCGRVGFPDYALTNNNANIHRVEGRIKALRAAKETGTTETETEAYKIVENTELMRIQIIFPDKPEAEVRDVLKSNGFKWAPSQGAWQRQLTTNARYALEKVKEALNKMQEGA
jgi:hypothetical protein